MLELARTGKSDFVIDLGCGDGRIVISAARDFGARGAGYDIDPARIAEAKEQARLAGVEQRTSFSQQNLFRAPLARATVVTVFLMPVVMDQLAPRLLSDLAPGTRVVSHSFPVHGWKPERVEHFEGRTLYLWTIPEREPLRPR